MTESKGPRQVDAGGLGDRGKGGPPSTSAVARGSGPVKEAAAVLQMLQQASPPDTCVEVRLVPPSEGQVMRKWLPVGAPIEPFLAGVARSARGRSVYYGAQPRRGEGGKAEDVAAGIAVWADLDRPAAKPSPLPTSVLVETSPGRFQALWLLDKPTNDVERIEALNRRIVAHLDADAASTDIAHVLRLPGFPNLKYANHPLARLRYCSPDRRYSLAELEAAFPEVAEGRPKPLSIAETLEGMVPGNRNVSLFRMACKLRSKGLGDADVAAFVRQSGRDQGLSDREIADILKSVARYPDGHEAEGEPPGPILVRLANVRREEVSWLWEGYIPRGRLTGVMGDPSVGKSWLTVAIAAAVTQGAPLPGQERGCEPGNVLILTAEDGLADTVRPRLEDMGADLTRVTVLTAVRDAKGRERHPSLVDDLDALESALAGGGYALVIIDPLNAYLGHALDTHRDAALRSVLSPLAALAERCKVAVVFVLHLNKGRRDRAIYRAQGSIAYTAAARVVHLVGQKPDNPTERALVPIKNNLVAMPPAIGFEIADGRFLWRGETSLTAGILLAPDGDDGERGALADAVGFLREALADGARPVKEVQQEATSLGIAPKTLRRARESLGVKSGRQGGLAADGYWTWTLPKLPIGDTMGSLGKLDAKSGPTGDGDGHLSGDGLRPTDGPLVRFAVQQLGLPIIQRRPPAPP